MQRGVVAVLDRMAVDQEHAHRAAAAAQAGAIRRLDPQQTITMRAGAKRSNTSAPPRPLLAVRSLGQIRRTGKSPDRRARSKLCGVVEDDAERVAAAGAQPADAVAHRQAIVAAGTARLEYDRTFGYLSSVLKALDVPVSSQTLVFSKTSFQAARIYPHSPRAIYFNDSVAVGHVRGGDIRGVAPLADDVGELPHGGPEVAAMIEAPAVQGGIRVVGRATEPVPNVLPEPGQVHGLSERLGGGPEDDVHGVTGRGETS